MKIHRRKLLGMCCGATVGFSAGCLRLNGDESEESGAGDEDTTPSETNRVEVVSTVGTDISDDPQTIGTVEMTVGRANPNNLDLSAITIQLVHSSGSYDLTYGSSNGESGAPNSSEFSITTVQDDDSSISEDQVLNDAGDRANIVLDVDDILGGEDNEQNNANGLAEGDTATVNITSESGETTEVRLTVPETLTGSEAVSL